MIPQIVSAILLSLPLIIMIICSINYWLKFRKEKKSGKMIIGKRTKYNKLFLYLLATGAFWIWPFWIGSIIFLFLNNFYRFFGFLTFSSSHETTVQIIGLVIFYIGANTYNLTIIITGKYLRPSTSGLLEEHKLFQNGPFAVMRHPLYMSYILTLIGLSFVLLIYWLLIAALCVIIGIYPTAKAEEKSLIEQFGEEYVKYKQKTGMFFLNLGDKSKMLTNISITFSFG